MWLSLKTWKTAKLIKEEIEEILLSQPDSHSPPAQVHGLNNSSHPSHYQSLPVDWCCYPTPPRTHTHV